MNEITTRDDARNALFKYLDTDTIWYGIPFLNQSYSHI